MAKVQETHPVPEVDLDKTDELPVLDMMKLSAQNADTQVPVRPDALSLNAEDRQSQVDLPALIASVQLAEERIAQQAAHQEALERDLGSLRGQLEGSTREVLRVSGEAQALRTTLAAREESLARALHTAGERDQSIVELRHQQSGLQQQLAESASAYARLKAESEDVRARMLDEHAATRDRLGEELSDARTRLGEELAQTRARLEHELEDSRSRIESGQQQLKQAQRTIGDLKTRIAQEQQALAEAQREAARYRDQSSAFLENLRTREWRRHHGEGLFRELDSHLAAAQSGRSEAQMRANTLATQLGEVQAQSEARAQGLRDLEATLARTQEQVRNLESALEATEQQQKVLAGDLEASRTDLARSAQELASLRLAAEAERKAAATQSAQVQDRLTEEISARDRMLQSERESRTQMHRQLESLEAAQAEHLVRMAEMDRMLNEAQAQKKRDDESLQRQSAAVEAVQADLVVQRSRADKLESELALVTTQLNEVRRPVEQAEAEIRELRSELQTKGQSLEQAHDQINQLQGQLERSKGALEEREFLIRRLERSASNSAQVLGRLQSSIERLGTGQAPAPAEQVVPAPAFTPSLIRIDNGAATTYALDQRTRIGRAPESEIRLDSSSVSRHHALILCNSRHCIIEDLNSTNGVVINGRKVSRHKMKDGDVIVIGDAQFKFVDAGALLPQPNPVSFAPS